MIIGQVYRGVEEASGAVVAIKTARDGEATASNLRSELRALSRMHDPRVVRVLRWGHLAGAPWYAMEFVEGRTWQEFNRQLWTVEEPEALSNPTMSLESVDLPDTGGLFPIVGDARQGRGVAAAGRLPEVLTLARRLCPALSILHGEGLVHRDLKPANVMIRPDGTPVLMDLGVVSRHRGAVGRERLEASGSLVGTVAYMAPEQARGLRVDARADLYSLGCMLYESVTGRLPISAPTLATLLSRVVHETPEPPSAVVDGVPPELEALILSLLEKDPRRRIGYADDVAQILGRLGADDPNPLPPARAYLYRPELVGRDEQVHALEEAIGAASAQRGAIVLIGGESGVGKTFLASEAARAARVRRLGVILGEALPTLANDATFLDNTGTPLHPLRPFFQALADRCRAGGEAVVAKLLRGHGLLLAPFEPALAVLPGGDRWPAPPELPAELARSRLLRALREVVEAWIAEQGPQLLVFDDLQWADDLTIGFLRGLDAEWLATHGLLVIGTWRTEELTDHLRPLVRDPHVQRVELARLDAGRVRSIVADMLAMADPPAELLRAVAGWSEGNPFFVAEYLRMAAAEGFIVRREGRWEFAGTGALVTLPGPASVQDLVARRLDGLSPNGRALVDLASVLGREFAFEPLVALAVGEGVAPDADGVADLLRDLEGRQVVEALHGERWRFTHDKVRETAHARLPADRRRRLHADAAKSIEERRVAGEPVPYRVLAYHWREAESWPRALDYLERAGEEALAGFSLQETIECFEEVVSVDAKLPERTGPRRSARWDRLLAEAWLDLGDQARGTEFVARALRKLGQPALPLTPGAQVVGLLGQVAARVAGAVAPRLFVESAPDRQAVALEAAHLYNRLLEPKMLNNEPLLGLYCGLRNLNLAERVAPSVALARGYGMMAAIVVNTPLKGVAKRWADRAVAVAETVGSGAALSYALHRGAVAYMAVGEYAEAHRRWDRSAALAERDGDRRRLDECRAGRAIAWSAQGRWAECVTEAGAALASSTERGDGQTAAWSRALLLEAYARLGREADVRSLATLTDLDRLGDAERTWLHISLALARLYASDFVGARQAADVALDITARSPPVGYFMGTPLGSLAEVYLRLWERALRDGSGSADELAARLDRAIKLIERLVAMNPFAAPFALTWRGGQAFAQGKRARAVERWKQAAERAQHLDMWHIEATASAELGLLGGDREALQRAAARFAQAGAAPDRVRVLQALG